MILTRTMDLLLGFVSGQNLTQQVLHPYGGIRIFLKEYTHFHRFQAGNKRNLRNKDNEN